VKGLELRNWDEQEPGKDVPGKLNPGKILQDETILQEIW
jgi:hypothetical protein